MMIRFALKYSRKIKSWWWGGGRLVVGDRWKNNGKMLIIVEVMGGSLHYSTFVCVLNFPKIKRDLFLFFVFEMQKCAPEGSLLIL